MSETEKRWFDAKKIVQAKGPFYDVEVCERHDWNVREEDADDGFYIVLESNGHKRPIRKSAFEERYERVV